MSQALSSTRRLGVLVAVGGLALTGLTACSSSKSSNSASSGSTGSSTSAAAASSSCPAIGTPAPTASPAKADGSGGQVTIYSADGLYDSKDDNNW